MLHRHPELGKDHRKTEKGGGKKGSDLIYHFPYYEEETY